MAELGRATMSNLVDILGIKDNLEESNHRQIERIKTRCIEAGIEVTFNEFDGKFECPYLSKILFLDYLEKINELEKKPNKYIRVFGRFRIERNLL